MSKELNLTDALVYSALYSRTTLSEKNGWIDADGRIYIFYSIENLSEDLHKGQTVIKAAIRKLIAVGLIETKRNFGAPSTIYVKLPNGRNTDPQSVGKPTEQGSENRPLDSRNSDRPSVGFPTTNYSNRATRDNSSSTIAAAPRTNSSLSEIVQHYENTLGTFPRSALDTLIKWQEVYSTELICKAFDEAAENNVRKWRYVDGILKGWQADGVRTLGDVEARRDARKKAAQPQEKKLEMLH